MSKLLFLLLLLLPFNLIISQTIPISDKENYQVSKSVKPTPTTSMTFFKDSIRVIESKAVTSTSKKKKQWNKTALLIGSSVIMTRIGFHIRWLIIKNREE